MNKITILLTTLNEEKNVKKIVTEITDKFNFNNYTILFVDDGSIDNTRDEIINIKKNMKILIIYLEKMIKISLEHI